MSIDELQSALDDLVVEYKQISNKNCAPERAIDALTNENKDLKTEKELILKDERTLI